MIETSQLPRHLGIIMDGNGRWARARGLPRVEGHREGAKSVKDVVRACRRLGVPALTLYAFSEQNWERPPEEVTALMDLLHQYLREERAEIMDNGIRLGAIGQLHRLPAFVRESLFQLIEDSKKNTHMTLTLALSYGGREDILAAIRKLVQDVGDGRLDPDEVNDITLASRLSTASLPPLDLVVRTSGELRLSNFLLWESAYAELYFTPLMWPEFRTQQLEEALEAYKGRQRRYGKVQ